MAEVLPINFPLPSESSIATYNYSDIASGVGYAEFFGFMENGGDYMLTDNSSFYSNASVTLIGAGATFNQNFDTNVFDSPRLLKGFIIANIPIIRGAGNSAKTDITLTAYHVDASSTATQLAQATGESVTTAAAYTLDNFMQCFIFPAINQQFKKGDTLRINVNIMVGNNTFYVGHDPVNRTSVLGASLPTKMSFLVPFRIDL